MLVWLGICAALCFAVAAAGAAWAILPAPTFVHLVFAAGAMPLVFGAIIHFVPVLTRSAPAEKPIQLLPLPVQMAGFATAATFSGLLPYWALHAAALLVSLLAAVVVAWIARRLRRAIGQPHPGARWYGAALLCLFFAVSLVPAWLANPLLRPALRLFHLHLNTLGFIGLAALGTLPVLLPTVLGRPDPQAGERLHRDLPFAVTGALLVAGGAAASPWLAVAGAALLLWGVMRNLRAWHAGFGITTLGTGRTAPLLAASVGLGIMLVLGMAHGIGGLPARPALPGFIVLFLLPLVTGALTHLLPVWRHAGPDGVRRQSWQVRLAMGGTVRAGLFFLGGMLLCFDLAAGWALALAGMLLFLAALARAVFLDSAGRSDDNPRPN